MDVRSFRYRLPGTNEIIDSRNDNGGLRFHVSAFSPNASSVSFPRRSTTREEHRRGVETILNRISSGKLDKCVLSRVILKEGCIDIDRTFENLALSYPDAFVFLFDSPETGIWMGASPELMLSKKGSEIWSMALAGTRPNSEPSEAEVCWDDKNIREQGIVTDFIAEAFRTVGFAPEVGKTQTVNAGPVQHLMTPVSARLVDDSETGLQQAMDLAETLSPTPALAGFPRNEALATIRETEAFDRGCYGGFCGPIEEAKEECAMFVNLRSMWIQKDRFALYAGGGIVEGSEPEAEWMETERKASTLLDKIVLL